MNGARADSCHFSAHRSHTSRFHSHDCRLKRATLDNAAGDKPAGKQRYLALGALLLLLFGWWVVLSPSPRALVVYCAHDAEYAEPLLKKFERETGIPLEIRFDTEATKSLSLVQLIQQEAEHPRCEVFWSGEILGTMNLAKKGLLTPYQGTGAARIPEKFKDPAGLWTGFGARLRVWIVNTKYLPPKQEAIDKAWQENLTKFAIAKPLYGTTLTHYAALWNLWGPDKLKAWHAESRKKGIQEVDGNARVKDLVKQGFCWAGFTDTDDYLVAKDQKYPVDCLPVRVGTGGTICIPNTIAIIKGTRHLPEAQRLVDFLLSEETELALAASAARQIPLGPVDETKLSDEVRQLQVWAREGIDLRPLVEARHNCLEWLKGIYLQ